MQHCCHSSHAQVAVCSPTFHFAPLPNCAFNSDATSGHAFGILWPAVVPSALRAPAPVN